MEKEILIVKGTKPETFKVIVFEKTPEGYWSVFETFENNKKKVVARIKRYEDVLGVELREDHKNFDFGDRVKKVSTKAEMIINSL